MHMYGMLEIRFPVVGRSKVMQFPAQLRCRSYRVQRQQLLYHSVLGSTPHRIAGRGKFDPR